MFRRLAAGVTRRPWWVIGAWLVAATALILLAPSPETKASQEAPAGAEAARAARLAEAAFPGGTADSTIIVVHRPDGSLTEADLAAVDRVAGELAPAGVLPLEAGGAVAENHAVALLRAGPSPTGSDAAAIEDLRRLVAEAFAGTGLSALVTGPSAVDADLAGAIADAERVVTAVTLGLIVVLLLAFFRSPVAVLLPLLAVGLVYGVSTALLGLGSAAWGVALGREVPTMLVVVLFGIGTDYVLFLLFRYRERLRAGDTPRQAIANAVERIGEVIFSAGFAVIVAFSALALASLGFFATMGPALAVSVLVMVLAALTLIPAVVTVLGRAVFWPSRAAAPDRRQAGRFTGWVGRGVARHSLAVAAGTAVLLGGLGAGAILTKADYDPISQLPSGSESARAVEVMRTGFPAGALSPTQVYLDAAQPLAPAQLEAVVTAVAALPGVAAPMPPQVSADGRTAMVPVLLAVDPYSAAAFDIVTGPLRDAARAAAPPEVTVLVGGESMLWAEIRDGTSRDLTLIFPLAGLLFALILAGLLRAVLAPLYLVLMVVAGFAATLGATTLLFQGAMGRGGLSFTLPIILYLFVTAIGTDYNILVTARLREEIRDRRTPREAAALAIAHAGPSVLAAALILSGTFATLLFAGVPFFTQIGFAVTVGILIVAFAVSLLLVPSVTALVGRAAWWPGRRSPVGSPPNADLMPEVGGVVQSGTGGSAGR